MQVEHAPLEQEYGASNLASKMLSKIFYYREPGVRVFYYLGELLSEQNLSLKF